MLDDRHYMRPEYRPPGRPLGFRLTATNSLLIALVIAFLIQYSPSPDNRPAVWSYFELSTWGMAHGFVWQLLTFQFMHAGISHLLCNGIALWSFGNAVEERLGKRRFLALYFLSGVAGGILQIIASILLPKLFGAAVVGASAGIFGVTAAFALLEPNAIVM